MKSGQHAPSLRERQKAQTRQHLLSAAAALIAERGYSETSMDDIAQAAGAARATVYSYFKTKDAILADLMRQLWDDADDMYCEFGQLANWSRTSVRAWVASVYKRWEADAARNRATVEVASKALMEQHDEHHRRHIQSLMGNRDLWLARFTTEQGQARASMLISLIETHVVNPYRRGGDQEVDVQIDLMTDVWLDVLRSS